MSKVYRLLKCFNFIYLGNNPTHAEVNHLMARADVDHNGKLDMKEFIRMMHNYNTEMTDPETEDLQRTREIMEAFRCKRRKIIQLSPF